MKNYLIILFLFPFVCLGQAKTISLTGASNKDSLATRNARLNKIFQSDSIQITASSNGCFHSETYHYKIMKKGGTYEVTLQNDLPYNT